MSKNAFRVFSYKIIMNFNKLIEFSMSITVAY